MLKKKCPFCQSNSYSSTAKGGPWICPNCKQDISHVAPEAPESGGTGHNDKPVTLGVAFEEFMHRIKKKYFTG